MMPQILGRRFTLTFEEFIRFTSAFWIKLGLVCENLCKVSGLWLGYENLISIFHKFSSSINKTFILARRPDARLSFYEV